jgi:hypothetical protein
MVDAIEGRILGGFHAVLNGTGTLVGPGSQDCAALVLGYFQFSLREKERANELSSNRGSASLVDDCFGAL